MIAAGGTGGHLFPALAVAEEIARRGVAEVRFFCRNEARELDRLAHAGLPAVGLPMRGLARRPGLSWGRTAWGALRSVLRARRELRSFRPELIVGMGSYISFPALWNARRMGVPYAVHEQNAWPGAVNRRYGAGAVEVWCADMQAARVMGWKNAVHTGYPLRLPPHDELRREPPPWPLVPGLPLLLVYGGSQGSLCLNRLMAEVLPKLRRRARFNAVIQTGERGYAAMAPQLAGEGTWVVPFIEAMDRALAHADLIVSRAGAGTLAEITAWGRAALLVPLAIAAGDHQAKNARALVDAGAAVMRREHELDAGEIVEWLARMLSDPSRRAEMADRSRALGVVHRNAARMVADRIQHLLERTKHHEPGHAGHLGGN